MILTLTERPTDFILTEKLEFGREAAHAAKTAIRLSLSYGGDGVKTMTMDNGGVVSAHGEITESIKETVACFVAPRSSWQKGATKGR